MCRETLKVVAERPETKAWLEPCAASQEGTDKVGGDRRVPAGVVVCNIFHKKQMCIMMWCSC